MKFCLLEVGNDQNPSSEPLKRVIGSSWLLTPNFGPSGSNNDLWYFRGPKNVKCQSIYQNKKYILNILCFDNLDLNAYFESFKKYRKLNS